MQAVQELCYVLCLCAQTAASGGDDRGIQAQALRNVDPGGGARNADLQLVRGLERGLVEADGGIDYAGGVRSIDFERSVVSRDHAHASDLAEVVGDGYGQRGAFLGIGGRSQFV